ncbi:MAG: cytochrome-c peroxidase [Bacteriovoracaceae bacterium]|nr:cytochrome-c peroxidase [Bacteriovoracaceae bacterium]
MIRKLFPFSIFIMAFNVKAMLPLPSKAEIPKDNLQSVEKINLGKTLYFDPRLSKNGTVSCNTCHNVMLGGDDQRSVSVGVEGQKGGRSAPTVWNSAFHTVQFWDGRAKSLEEQAVGPITNPIEMGMSDFDLVIKRLSQIPGYVLMFDNVFGKNGISKENIGKAIASFERTLISGNSEFDKYMHGNKKAISAQKIRGMKLVQEIGCTACHSGVNFNGENLKMGEGNFQKFPVVENDFIKKYNLSADLGRFNVTKNEDDKNMWRVPTWRNIAITAPYFHNGAVRTLDEAVRVMAKSQLDMNLKDDQVKDIVAFLESLTGTFPRINMPRLPESTSTTVLDLE